MGLCVIYYLSLRKLWNLGVYIRSSNGFGRIGGRSIVCRDNKCRTDQCSKKRILILGGFLDKVLKVETKKLYKVETRENVIIQASKIAFFLIVLIISRFFVLYLSFFIFKIVSNIIWMGRTRSWPKERAILAEVTSLQEIHCLRTYVTVWAWFGQERQADTNGVRLTAGPLIRGHSILGLISEFSDQFDSELSEL